MEKNERNLLICCPACNLENWVGAVASGICEWCGFDVNEKTKEKGVSMEGFASNYRYEVERDENWSDITQKVPTIKFPSDWEVSIIPPFGGAVARFRVKAGEQFVSVYLDWYNKLGWVGEPYWEVYPIDGDCARCLLKETDELIELIKKSIAELKGNKGVTNEKA